MQITSRRLALLSLLGSAVLLGCGGTSSSRTSSSTATQSSTRSSTTSRALSTTHRSAAPSALPSPNAGKLPQTNQLPSAATATFRAEMAALWEAVRSDNPSAGAAAFFPESAYVQVKAIANPQSDYVSRLFDGYAADIHAAHQLLGADARSARLLSVQVPSSYAHWVQPGVCYNRVGYYEVPNARVVYSTPAGVHSFGIASMISWRGTWYVVHLGAVVRPGTGGVVDDPSAGPGVSAPSSTC